MSTDPVSPDANAARAAPAPFIRSRAGPDSEPPGDAGAYDTKVKRAVPKEDIRLRPLRRHWKRTSDRWTPTGILWPEAAGAQTRQRPFASVPPSR